jgi:DNA repair protein RadC
MLPLSRERARAKRRGLGCARSRVRVVGESAGSITRARERQGTEAAAFTARLHRSGGFDVAKPGSAEPRLGEPVALPLEREPAVACRPPAARPHRPTRSAAVVARTGRVAAATDVVPPPRRALREVPPEERPRERLAVRGPAGLSSAELIAIIWGSGTAGRNVVDLASDAVAVHGGLASLAAATPAELAVLPGVGTARAAQLLAAFELGRRLVADWPAGRLLVRTPRDLADRLVPQMGRLEREELRVILLTAKNQVLGIRTVYQGNVSSTLVRVGELFHDAVRQHAAGIILVHNHPSGDPTPSPDDLHLTAEAVAAGRLLDLPVLDHLVIGHDSFVSLRDRGVVFDRPGAKA